MELGAGGADMVDRVLQGVGRRAEDSVDAGVELSQADTSKQSASITFANYLNDMKPELVLLGTWE